MPKKSDKSRRPRNGETAAQFARRKVAELAPASINDLIRKVQVQTRKKIQWQHARDIFNAFAGKASRPADSRRTQTTAAPARPAAREPELFILLAGKRNGRKSEAVELSSRAEAERLAMELMRKGQVVRIIRGTEAKLGVYLS